MVAFSRFLCPCLSDKQNHEKFIFHRAGSIIIFQLVVPDNNELARGTLRAILHQASLNDDEFNAFCCP
jgi:hypothetical protein